MLRDLIIHNYRCFQDFHVDGLARVNLIVGKNNSGKSSLLEAAYLLVTLGDPQRLIELLNNRGEIVDRSSGASGEPLPSRREYQIIHLFHGRQLEPNQAIDIQSQRDRQLALAIRLNASTRQASLFDVMEPQSSTESSGSASVLGPLDTGIEFLPEFELVIQFGLDSPIVMPVRGDGSMEGRAIRPSRPPQPHHRLLTANNLSLYQLARIWDGITLTPKEDIVLKAMRILDPKVERISFTSRQSINSGILLKLRGQRDPVPLGSMGDGMRRILTLTAAAAMAENGVLFVDEIDTGLYYTTLSSMWRSMIDTARRTSLQIFATTHSWDCVRAFQEASIQSEDPSDGLLFRMSLRDKEIEPVLYSPDELAVAMQQDIEVR